MLSLGRGQALLILFSLTDSMTAEASAWLVEAGTTLAQGPLTASSCTGLGYSHTYAVAYMCSLFQHPVLQPLAWPPWSLSSDLTRENQATAGFSLPGPQVGNSLVTESWVSGRPISVVPQSGLMANVWTACSFG